MEPPTEEIKSELDNFRAQWRAEVSARSKNAGASSSGAAASQQPPPPQQQQARRLSQGGPSSLALVPPRKGVETSSRAHRKSTSKTIPAGSQLEGEDEYVRTLTFDEPQPEPGTAAAPGVPQQSDGNITSKEPQTALELYEQAVGLETTGKLGESLRLYRRAFRMDNNVDLKYRNKHFAAKWAKTKPPAQQVNPSNAPATVPNTAHHSLQDCDWTAVLSLPELIASFAGLSIESAPPECEGMQAPPCPIASLPDEILIHILADVAVLDVGDFVRLSLVCKRFAYLVATEGSIWRRVCLGSEFGFGGMVYHWQRGYSWEELDPVQLAIEDDDFVSVEDTQRRHDEESAATTLALFRSLYTSSWQKMFRQRPRIRFNGCYISTVNYIRAGQSSGYQITWNSPVHIVTYYRYLRLFRDGTVISLLTTAEPADVVHHLTKDNLLLHQNDAALHLPSSVMQSAMRGRWHLSSSIDNPEADVGDVEGDLFVETEGVGKYMYRLELSLKSAGKGARNNKLVWKGFWSYNKLTDDWGEFGLKNDKAFYFSRVKSYGFSGM